MVSAYLHQRSPSSNSYAHVATRRVGVQPEGQRLPWADLLEGHQLPWRTGWASRAAREGGVGCR